ncbi:MAG: class I SAM-dependent methyltransferase [Gammaproteobacteria bacterium]|nr:class I SAM-dependent methyltransferase [Gammaproteobacteria bacterium]MCK5262140.1 class I SAM-dependent methyltransferase [Gammaproteobacteria bacterium]
MEKIDYAFMQAVDEAFDIKTRIIELGARVIENQKPLSARNIFNKGYSSDEYTGLDYIEGDHVDIACDVRELPFEDKSINTVIAMNLFEHVEESWRAFDEIKRVIGDDGTVIIATPFCYNIHGCPYDYYRYTPSFYTNTFKDFDTKITVTIGYNQRPKMVYFIGGNNKSLGEDFEKFKAIYAEKHKTSLKPMSKFLAKIRSKLSPNHFRNDIRYQHTFDINIEKK